MHRYRLQRKSLVHLLSPCNSMCLYDYPFCNEVTLTIYFLFESQLSPHLSDVLMVCRRLVYYVHLGVVVLYDVILCQHLPMAFLPSLSCGGVVPHKDFFVVAVYLCVVGGDTRIILIFQFPNQTFSKIIRWSGMNCSLIIYKMGTFSPGIIKRCPLFGTVENVN